MLNLKTLLGLLLLVLSQQIYAQKIQQLKKGNRYYKQKKYEKALDIYETLSETTGGNKVLGVDGKINLADCYRILEQPKKAASLYQEFLEYAEDRPSMHLEYGQVLMDLGQYDEAIVHFGLLGKDRKGEIASAAWIQECERIQAIEPVYAEVKLTNQANINDAFSNESSPSYFGNHLVFVTDELGQDLEALERQIFRISAVNRLGDYEKSRDFGGPINQSKRENNSITFSRDGKTLIYAQNYTHKDGKDYTELRVAYFVDSAWSPSQSLGFVLEKYNYKHPSLSADGKTLYFASDMSGTLGGLDLWEVHKEEGTWGMPINLGKNINTKADDAWPFAHPDGDLFFASKGYLSYGGYDIYRTRPLGNGVDWLPVENLGAAINSSFNDISFVLSDDQTEAFYASNRANSYDIYRAELLSEEAQVLAHIPARQSHGQAALGRTLLDVKETKMETAPITQVESKPWSATRSSFATTENTSKVKYGKVAENEFIKTEQHTLSTFSIDVAGNSYSMVRDYLEQMQLPPVDAIRIEELVNYFEYNYFDSTEKNPVSVVTEISDCPWNKDAKLLQITLQGKPLELENDGAFYAIAEDVTLALVFNPEWVKYYRLVGYENRTMEHVDFENDSKDAGELGAGHTVTAMYELLLNPESDEALFNEKDALLTVNLRYKKPTEETSILLEQPVSKKMQPMDMTSENYRFAAAVASFGMLLRDSKFKNNLKYQQVLELAESAKGADAFGYRQEFIEMVRKVDMMTKRVQEPK